MRAKELLKRAMHNLRVGAFGRIETRRALVKSSMGWVDDHPGIALPHLTLQTVIGITVAIAGNILVSLALNLQKLAHLRLDHGRQNNLADVERESRPPQRDTSTRAIHPDTAARFGALQHNHQYETQPLIPHRSSSQPPPTTYGLAQYDALTGDDARSRRSSNALRPRRRQHHKRSFASRFLPVRSMLEDDPFGLSNHRVDDSSAMPVGDVFPQRNTQSNHRGKGKGNSHSTIGDGDEKETDYLHSKIWFVTHGSRLCDPTRPHRWSGFVLMNIGETGNFISYAFAPASLVAPLGTVRCLLAFSRCPFPSIYFHSLLWLQIASLHLCF